MEPGMVHLGVVREIYPLLQERGADSEKVISEAGLDPALFDDGTNVVSFRAVGRLVRNCVLHTGILHFGMLVGARATLHSLGLVGSVMRHSATTGAALAALEAHLGVQNRGAVPQLEVSGDIAVFSFLPYDLGMIGAASYVEGGIATTVSAIRELVGHEWAPSEVLLPRAQPFQLKPYWHYFRAPVRFNQELAAIVFPAAFLETPVKGADPNVLRELMIQVTFLEDSSHHNISDRLRRLVRKQLVHAHCSVDGIAHSLDMNRRTLNRRLKAEGTTARKLADEMRFEVARQLLAETGLELSAVAAALDFSEPAAFNHAFRRWAGCTPSEWRRLHAEPYDAVPHNNTGGGA